MQQDRSGHRGRGADRQLGQPSLGEGARLRGGRIGDRGLDRRVREQVHRARVDGFQLAIEGDRGHPGLRVESLVVGHASVLGHRADERRKGDDGQDRDCDQRQCEPEPDQAKAVGTVQDRIARDIVRRGSRLHATSAVNRRSPSGQMRCPDALTRSSCGQPDPRRPTGQYGSRAIEPPGAGAWTAMPPRPRSARVARSASGVPVRIGKVP